MLCLEDYLRLITCVGWAVGTRALFGLWPEAKSTFFASVFVAAAGGIIFGGHAPFERGLGALVSSVTILLFFWARGLFRGSPKAHLIIGMALFLTFPAFRLLSAFAPSPDPAVLAKLAGANHVGSPSLRISLWKQFRVGGFKHALLTSLSEERRHVPELLSGKPQFVFGLLAYLGNYGEIIWPADWKKMEVDLPSPEIFQNRLDPPRGPDQLPRKDVVAVALSALDKADGCLIKAGHRRYVVVKKSERDAYLRAIRFLGWRNGTNLSAWKKRSESSSEPK